MQLHDMGTGYISQRVVIDIGNYFGKFIESHIDYFIGVWREYLRVKISIPLDVPIKRRMKLTKSMSKWAE